jgi:hypothetical protein
VRQDGGAWDGAAGKLAEVPALGAGPMAAALGCKDAADVACLVGADQNDVFRAVAAAGGPSSPDTCHRLSLTAIPWGFT